MPKIETPIAEGLYQLQVKSAKWILAPHSERYMGQAECEVLRYINKHESPDAGRIVFAHWSVGTPALTRLAKAKRLPSMAGEDLSWMVGQMWFGEIFHDMIDNVLKTRAIFLYTAR